MKEIFSKIKKEIESKDKVREELIVNSRPIIKNSKQAIYAMHRSALKEAKKLIDIANKDLDKLRNITNKQEIGAFNAALQEYAEAVTYYYYLTEQRLVKPGEIKVDAENYLLGVCDLTGELSRKAVFSVVNEKYSEVEKIKDFVSEIYNEFLKFSFRNSELRKKSDSIKWNLKKIEEIMYDLKIRGKI